MPTSDTWLTPVASPLENTREPEQSHTYLACADGSGRVIEAARQGPILPTAEPCFVTLDQLVVVDNDQRHTDAYVQRLAAHLRQLWEEHLAGR